MRTTSVPPVLAPNHQAYVIRAHRIRSAAVADMVRKVAQWVATASR